MIKIKSAGIAFLWFFIACTTAGAEEKKITFSLPQAIQWAMERNRAVIQSKNSINVSRLSLDSANSDFNIMITPSAGAGVTDGSEDINVGASLTKKFTRGMALSFSPGISMGDDHYTSRVGVSLDIPLFKGRGELVNMATVRGAEYSLRMALMSLHRTKTNTIIQAVTSFYTIVEYKKKVELNAFLVESFKDHAVLSKLKSDIGLAGPLDVYRARIKVKDAEADMADAIESLQNEKYTLKSILAISQDREIEVVEPPLEIETVEMDVAEAESIALENSIDIRCAKDAFAEARRASKIARHNLLPDLKLSLNYSRAGESDAFSDTFALNDDRWMVFLTSSSDFARTREKLSHRQSLINIESVRIDLDNTRDQVRKNVRSQLDNLAKAEDLILIRKQQIHQAKGKKALAELKFNNDMADNFNLIEAETELHRARINFLNAQINYVIGTYRLREIMGTLLAYHEG